MKIANQNKQTRRALSLFFIVLSVLLIALMGFYFLKKTELLLQARHNESIFADAQAIASRISKAISTSTYSHQSKMLFVHANATQLQMDGYAQDWIDSLLLRGGVELRLIPDQKVLIFAAETKDYFRLLIEVKDQSIIYRNSLFPNPEQADHIRLKLTSNGTEFILSPFAETALSAINLHNMQWNHDIQGQWRETETGYRVEIQIPKNQVHQAIWLSIIDIDDPEIRSMKTTIGGKKIQLIRQNKAIKTLLSELVNPNFRIRILDQSGWIIADKKPLKSFLLDKKRELMRLPIFY